MIVAFANNQVMVAEAGTPTRITTDPVPMNGNDRITLIGNVAYLYGGTSRDVALATEVSNDGVTWVVAGVSQTLSAVGAGSLQSGTVAAAFIRMVFTFTVNGSGSGAVCFDAHVNLDKS